MSLNKFTIQKSFAISAGAGSGKTYTLSRRYINALLGFDYFREDYDTQSSYFEDLKPARVSEIVTITYTEAAALEMKGRIFELVAKIINPNLSKNDKDYDSIQDASNAISQNEQKYVQATLKQAYTDSSNSKISTIHAYCLDIIKANSDIARIDAKLDIIKDDEKQKELSNIIFEVLNAKENETTVLDIAQDVSIFFINGLISKYVSDSKFRHDYDNFKSDSIDIDTYKELIYELYPLPDIDDVRTELQNDADRLKWFEEFYENFIDFNAKSWKEVNEDFKAPSMGAKKYPISDPIKKELESGTYLSVYSNIDTVKESLFFDKIEKIQELLHQIKNRYDSKLNELNKVDFDTIITKTLEIIPHVKTQFKYIMVDEFQDTNATQFEIVKSSCNSKTNLFVVGDSKQSIYSFQGAEIEVFNDAIEDKSIFSSIEDMSQNYRSDSVVLDNVNSIFKKLLQKNTHFKLLSQNYEAQAQDLYATRDGGSFRYLITSQPYKEELSELDTIAQLISEIYNNEHTEYTHISKLISKKEKAIAIVFDSSTKMLELKQKLRERGITAKVSASDNFYHTKEVNDIFNTLKAIDILSRKEDKLSNTQKYYVVGAMRSNILRCDDNSIKNYLDTNTVDNKLSEYINIAKNRTLSETVKYIYDDSNIFGVYAHYEDIEQRAANLYKFLTLCMEYENSNESNLYSFLSLIENAIYFSEAKEDEAFFKSDNTKSIEICSIHSTKGLAYPLVLLANSDKGLYSQVTSDSLKHNSFTLNGVKKEIVGFKVNDYTPLSHRVLKEIDKLKHLAEKKRLLYVALTRAEHDVIISAQLKQKADGSISLREDSYLHMICHSLDIDIDELYGQHTDFCISLNNTKNTTNNITNVRYIQHSLKPLTFKSQALSSATVDSETKTVDNTAANLGTVTHKVIELYWNSFHENKEAILDKMMIFDKTERESIIKHMNRFYETQIYKLLKDGIKHHFELEFYLDNTTGFIDFIYFDESQNGWVIVDFKTGVETKEKDEYYQRQLDFYKEAMTKLNYNIIDAKLLWL
ncbi:MAG: UvrD-helicase domain-containing protein [Epsilonproteobacteria bacterium]|nr:UvrD-helicase domain-containing protein [Campylobacterota bacterium]